MNHTQMFTLISLLMATLGLNEWGQNPLGAGEQQERWMAPAWADTLENPFSGEDEAALSRGQEMYDVYCWTCHGVEGKGDGTAGMGMDPSPANFTSKEVAGQSDGALFWKLATGRGNMVGYKDLFPEEVRWQIVTYLRHLSKQKS